jgi:hypothetical protein
MDWVFSLVNTLREYVRSVGTQSELSREVEKCWALGYEEEARFVGDGESHPSVRLKPTRDNYAGVTPAVKGCLSRAYACVGGGDRSLPYEQYSNLVRACQECGRLAGDAHMRMTHMESQAAYERMAAETASGYAHTHEHTAHTPESPQNKRADEAEARIQRMLTALAKIIADNGAV